MHISLPLFHNTTLTLHLFASVKNSSHILTSLKSQDSRYDYCFLDCRRVCSLDQIVSAVCRALRDSGDGVMRTKTLYSEIVYAMGPGTNISDSLKRFGIAEDSSALVCLAIDSVSLTIQNCVV